MLIFMRSCWLPLLVILAIGVLYPFEATSFSSGAPPRRTGAPGDLSTCNTNGCHNSFALNSGPGRVVLRGPATYEPGVPLDVAIHVAQAGATRFGFEVTAKDARNQLVGTFTLVDANTRFTLGNLQYVTHQSVAHFPDSASWTVQWTPPAELTDSITFYVAASATPSNNEPAHIYTAAHSLTRPQNVQAERAAVPPMRLVLHGNYPNPFNPTTTLRFDLPEAAHVSLEVVDLLGRRMLALPAQPFAAGSGQLLPVEAGTLASGVYLYRLTAQGAQQTWAGNGRFTLVR
jgi:hypothetical protein